MLAAASAQQGPQHGHGREHDGERRLDGAEDQGLDAGIGEVVEVDADEGDEAKYANDNGSVIERLSVLPKGQEARHENGRYSQESNAECAHEHQLLVRRQSQSEQRGQRHGQCRYISNDVASSRRLHNSNQIAAVPVRYRLVPIVCERMTYRAATNDSNDQKQEDQRNRDIDCGCDFCHGEEFSV